MASAVSPLTCGAVWENRTAAAEADQFSKSTARLKAVPFVRRDRGNARGAPRFSSGFSCPCCRWKTHLDVLIFFCSYGTCVCCESPAA